VVGDSKCGICHTTTTHPGSKKEYMHNEWKDENKHSDRTRRKKRRQIRIVENERNN
jgi:hypothetical protein